VGVILIVAIVPVCCSEASPTAGWSMTVMRLAISFGTGDFQLDGGAQYLYGSAANDSVQAG
jgi:hypothetical protein